LLLGSYMRCKHCCLRVACISNVVAWKQHMYNRNYMNDVAFRAVININDSSYFKRISMRFVNWKTTYKIIYIIYISMLTGAILLLMHIHHITSTLPKQHK